MMPIMPKKPPDNRILNKCLDAIGPTEVLNHLGLKGKKYNYTDAANWGWKSVEILVTV